MEIVVAYFKALPHYLPAENEESQEEPQSWYNSIWTEIQSRELLNKKQVGWSLNCGIRS